MMPQGAGFARRGRWTAMAQVRNGSCPQARRKYLPAGSGRVIAYSPTDNFGIPAELTTRVHFTISLAIRTLNCAGDVPVTS